MIVYSISEVEDTPTGEYYTASLRHARRIAHDLLQGGRPAVIVKHSITERLSLNLLVRALNHIHWCQTVETIAEYSPDTEGG